MEIVEVSSSGNLPNDKMDVVEEYSEGDLKVMKGNVNNSKNLVFNGVYTFAEFDKDGRHFLVTMFWDDDIDNLNLSDDVNLIKKLKESTKPKEVPSLEYYDDYLS